MTNTDRPLPHDLDIEKSVLGAMLSSKEALKVGLDLLTTDAFYRDKHRIIFEALRDTGAADHLAVAANIKSRGYSEPDKSDLHECYEACLDPLQIESHAEMVLDLSRRREDITAMDKAMAAAYKGDDYTVHLGEVASQPGLAIPTTIDGASLAALDLPPLTWTVPGILPTGFCLFAGLPKVGKSFLSLNISLAKAFGGKVLGKDVTYGEVLVLALEDGPRRLQSRMVQMLNGDAAPDSLHFAMDWPNVDNGGIEHIENFLELHPDTGLVVVDTLAKMRTRPTRNGSIYLDDYHAIEPLKRLADDHGITVLAVHHLRKAESTRDPLDEVSGSTGLTGAADTILLLRRSRGRSDAELHVIGRDIEDRELAADFDAKNATWNALGPAEEFRQSEERHDILEVVRDAGGPIGPHAVATVLEVNENTVGVLMRRMADQGQLEKRGRGKYVLPTPADVIPFPSGGK